MIENNVVNIKHYITVGKKMIHMDLKITLHNIVIQDKDSGDEFTIKSVRTAKELAEEIEQGEKDAAIYKIESVLYDAY